MDNENRNQRGNRVAQISPQRLRRLILLGVAGALALALLIWGIVFAIDALTAPRIKPVDRVPDVGLDTPGRTDGPDDGPASGEITLDNTMKKNFYTFLIVGTSDDYNTDTIMLGAVDTKTLECNIISIPRDCMYDTDAKIKRINGAFGRGGGFNKSNGGIKNLCEVVQSVTGVYPQYYCVLKMDSFIKVVDAIGGVEFDVPFHMYHEDADPKYHIDLPAGKRVLNGKEAIQLVRFRGYAMSDFGRITMQKQFLITTMQTVKDEFDLANATKVITTITDSIKTNMDAADAVWFYSNVVSKMDLNSNIIFHTLPTEGTGKYNGQDYVYIDKSATLKLVNETVNPYTTPITRGELHGILKLED